MTIITVKTCTQKVAEQTKVSDSRCPGFYVSLAAGGTVTFSLRYWNKKVGAQRTVEIGTHQRDDVTVEVVDAALASAFDLRGKAGRGVDISARAKVMTPSGMSVGHMIDDFIAATSKLEKKADGEMRPTLESWKNVAGFLNNEVRATIGTMAPADVTNNDIALVQQNIAERSTSGARQTRSAMKRLFAFGCEAGRNSLKYGLTTSPVHNLPKVKPEHPRRVVLTADEIRTFWWGLDHPGLPASKQVALALKFELVMMLRSKEFLNARTSFIAGHGTETPVLRVPMKFVKKRRGIEQPLNSLAVEIVSKATAGRDGDVAIFASDNGAALHRNVLSSALRGKRGMKRSARVTMGICQFLGLKDFTPHDLRRSAASLCGDIQIPDAEIAKCLDHQKGAGENVSETPSVTGRVYVHSKRLTEKRAVLNALDAELRRIIGLRPKELPRARLTLVG